jgi:hypothetical protein
MHTVDNKEAFVLGQHSIKASDITVIFNQQRFKEVLGCAASEEGRVTIGADGEHGVPPLVVALLEMVGLKPILGDVES